MIDIAKLRSFDTETHRFRPGRMAPPVVCGSASLVVDGNIRGELLHGNVFEIFRRFLDAGYTIAFANAAYDLAVAAEHDPTLLPLIYKAIDENRIHDVLIGEGLNAIYHGHHGLNPDFTPLRKPSTGKVVDRYSLDVVSMLVLGRVDAKANDAWQNSYFLLDGIPLDRWPIQPRVYPVDDSSNTFEIAMAQIFGLPGSGRHVWQEVPAVPGVANAAAVCKICGLDSWSAGPRCAKALPEPHQNLGNMAAQVEFSLAQHLGNCHSLRTDPEEIAKLTVKLEAENAIATVRFQKCGWLRIGRHSWKQGSDVCRHCGTQAPNVTPDMVALVVSKERCAKDPDDGKEDQAAVKRSLAVAYGASVAHRRCSGTGRVRNATEVECRGLKERGRYQGCLKMTCTVCKGRGTIWKYGNEVTCKNVFDEADPEKLITEGCDGTGFDLNTVPLLPRSKKDGVKTDRDAKMESGNDDLSDYGENEADKALTTYLPYLRKGIHAPLDLQPNSLVASGRCSYGTIHQFPRKGGLRECVRARGEWCGVPVEYCLCSTDYAAGELCSLAQVTYWYEGQSRMLELINETRDPGSLHTMIAAQMLGTTLEDVKARIKAGDQQAKDFRQASKPASFGFPGGLGSATLVLTSRRKNAGMTTGPDGHEYAGIRFCILIAGAERCGVEKVIEWNRKECPPVCKACVKAVEEMLKPTFFKTYPEVKRYLDRISGMVRGDRHIPAPAWNAARKEVEVLRLRGKCGYTDGANQGFQGLLADIFKRAFCRMTREGYLGIKADGSPSPLAGGRFPVGLHDEPLAELIRRTAHLSAPRIAEIMMECGTELAPDVYWKAEPALMLRWYKEAEPVYSNGILVPWEPKAKAA